MKTLTKDEWESLKKEMEVHETGVFDYMVRNLMVGDGEDYRIVEQYEGKSIEEIQSELPKCSDEIPRLIYEYCNHYDDEENYDEDEAGSDDGEAGSDDGDDGTEQDDKDKAIEATGISLLDVLKPLIWNPELCDTNFNLWESFVCGYYDNYEEYLESEMDDEE